MKTLRTLFFSLPQCTGSTLVSYYKHNKTTISAESVPGSALVVKHIN